MQPLRASNSFEVRRESGSNLLCKEELDRAADQIVDRLNTSGYAYVPGHTTMDWCDGIASRLGNVAGKSDVIFDPERDAAQRKTRTFKPDRPSVYLGGDLGLHNDNPYWNVLGWYCVEQDAAAGASILVDTSDIAEHFRQEELELLWATHLLVPSRDAAGKEIALAVPVLTKSGERYGIYWVPWLKLDSYPEAQRIILDRLGEWLLHKQETEAIEIRLRSGECLFIDNSRMLHGRRSLSEQSRRHLIRLSIGSSRVGVTRAS
jgi:Taurine catabolism dioxygenase TauD, TfdA family